MGTSKIVAAVAEVLEDGALNIIGMGQTSSRGLRGMVVNIESPCKPIQRAVEEAELMAGCTVHHSPGIYRDCRQPLKSVNSHGMVAIQRA